MGPPVTYSQYFWAAVTILNSYGGEVEGLNWPELNGTIKNLKFITENLVNFLEKM